MPTILILAQSTTRLQSGMLQAGAAPGLAQGLHACQFCRDQVFVDEGAMAQALSQSPPGVSPTICCHRCAIGDMKGYRRLPLPDSQHREVRDAMYQLLQQSDEGRKLYRRMRRS